MVRAKRHIKQNSSSRFFLPITRSVQDQGRLEGWAVGTVDGQSHTALLTCYSLPPRALCIWFIILIGQSRGWMPMMSTLALIPLTF